MPLDFTTPRDDPKLTRRQPVDTSRPMTRDRVVRGLRTMGGYFHPQNDGDREVIERFKRRIDHGYSSQDEQHRKNLRARSRVYHLLRPHEVREACAAESWHRSDHLNPNLSIYRDDTLGVVRIVAIDIDGGVMREDKVDMRPLVASTLGTEEAVRRHADQLIRVLAVTMGKSIHGESRP